MSADAFPRRIRALLTETLPFELPLIFTNEFRYGALLSPPETESVRPLWSKIAPQPQGDGFTVPYLYRIRKDRSGSTTLGLVHPEGQVAMAEFYGSHAESLLAACSLSRASLRYPAKIAKIYSQLDLSPEPTKKTGSVHVEPEPEAEAIDISRLSSFFSYRDFNLLSKFYDSPAYLILEKKFSKLRTIDVSRCFYNLYTHSVTWAVKSKSFAKSNANMFSFEQQFDRLMQRINYNETNGIVVGPELSRIFAEVIFQRIDVELERRLEAAEKPIKLGLDYNVRRYVDDFFIYASDSETIDRVQHELEVILEEYKLYINSSKIANYERPFVTPLSTARREVRRAIFDLKACVDKVHLPDNPKDFRAVSKAVRDKTVETRLIIGEHGVGFHNISGWCLAVLSALISQIFDELSKAVDINDDKLACFERSLWALLSLVFYIVSLDIRVTTTYALGNLLTTRDSKGFARLREHSDWIDHIIEQEMIDLAQHSHGAFFLKANNPDSVETMNLLILGAHMFGKSYVNNSVVLEIITDLMECPLSYFRYIALKFVMLKDTVFHAKRIDDLNSAAMKIVTDARRDLESDSEKYYLFCDIVSAPDLTPLQKQAFWKSVHSTQPPTAALKDLGQICGFADWTGVRLTHSLKRKRLRPVYE